MKVGKETLEQIKIVDWVKANTDLPIIHIPNEGKRSYVMSHIMKRMGLMAGVSDLFIPRRNIRYSGLWLEVKAEGGKVSAYQEAFIHNMLKENYMALCVWGADSGIEFIKSHYSL